MAEHEAGRWADYQTRLDRVIDYIHDHLNEHLDLHQLTEVACSADWQGL